MFQRLLKGLLPATMFDRVKSESQGWLATCSCGRSTSIWDLGGVRYKASGEKRTMIRCEDCGVRSMHRVHLTEAPAHAVEN